MLRKCFYWFVGSPGLPMKKEDWVLFGLALAMGAVALLMIALVVYQIVLRV